MQGAHPMISLCLACELTKETCKLRIVHGRHPPTLPKAYLTVLTIR